MKSKFLRLFIILFLSSTSGQSQKFLSLELGGSGGLASINLENPIIKKEKFQLNWRAGFSLAPVDRNNGTVLVFPLMAHGLLGNGKHKLDVGVGQTISITTKGQFFFLMPACVGYRLQPEEKRFYFRVAYTPIISYLIDFQVQHWFGITFGFKLGKQK